ncbi:hypothetical protein RSB1_gp04 [Ralstonia phage RSB1]|uniref:Uncharacterized protein n=1 Tax=Ralstonia phage RSB1 TaxID=551790 RepID=B5BTU0_9CAUD|nr:hypothetical protein RSB1_gp04 [Ralstonia phage RSB1]BAG70362.1 hypothetical protein [Ralstonia phage RSB1]
MGRRVSAESLPLRRVGGGSTQGGRHHGSRRTRRLRGSRVLSQGVAEMIFDMGRFAHYYVCYAPYHKVVRLVLQDVGKINCIPAIAGW